MERLLTSCSAPAVVLLFLLITRASSAAVSSRSLLFNHMNDVNNNNHERTLSQEKSGSDSPASSSWRDAASRPPSSLANHRTAGRARLFNVTELLCPKCILQPLLTGGSPSLPVPSAGGASPSSTSSTNRTLCHCWTRTSC
ncbi:hypothetical protein SK128_010469 [Halocaridina rubra]|uniref:Secreted protein n=1 Tax=Halocaridina rubra TaxID=373956 RepID=A0AAN8X9X3_HALRR